MSIVDFVYFGAFLTRIHIVGNGTDKDDCGFG
jgi:hypothetical protein